MEDYEIVDRLLSRSESGLEEVSKKYKSLYQNVIRQFLDREEDIAECENDVLMAVWSSIPPNCPKRLSSYICGLARNIGVNKYKYNTRAKRTAGYTLVIEELSECIPDRNVSCNHAEALEAKELNQALSGLVETLDAETRTIFIRRYYYLETVESLAKRYGISKNKVSVTLCRARKKLKTLLEKEAAIYE